MQSSVISDKYLKSQKVAAAANELKDEAILQFAVAQGISLQAAKSGLAMRARDTEKTSRLTPRYSKLISVLFFRLP